MSRFQFLFTSMLLLTGALVSGSAEAQTCSNNACVTADYPGNEGPAIWGFLGMGYAGYGVIGQTAASASGATNIAGVAGCADATCQSPDNMPVGVFGETPGTNGNGVVGVHGTATISSSYSDSGVYGASSDGNGVVGTSSDSSGSGVAGVNSGSGYGVWASSSSGYGVYGTTTSGVAGVYGHSASLYGYGVYASTTGNDSWGLFSECTGTGCGAGYFSGAVDISGTMEVFGAAEITGELTVGSCSGCTSDARLKKNVRSLDGALDQLLQLKGVTFEWIDPSQHKGDTSTQRGFLAQDVEKVFPNWVNQAGYTGPDGQKYKTLELRQIEALEVESIRELKTQNDDLRGKLEENQARTAKLEERLGALLNGRDPIRGEVGFGGGMVCLAGLVVTSLLGLSRRKRSEPKA
jgi:hypothetical protein